MIEYCLEVFLCSGLLTRSILFNIHSLITLYFHPFPIPLLSLIFISLSHLLPYPLTPLPPILPALQRGFHLLPHRSLCRLRYGYITLSSIPLPQIVPSMHSK